MKVSIITVCFNRCDTIRSSIESVISQDYSPVEYIVVDGASTDGTLDVIYSYREYIDKIVSEPDHGMYEAINKGIRLATGDIIGLVHSDDMLWDNQVVGNIVQRFEETDADIIYGDGVFVDSISNKVKRNWRGGWFSRLKVKLGWLPLHPTCYMKRSVLMEKGLYDESYQIAADTEVLVRFFLDIQLKIVYYPRKVIRMRLGGLSTDSETRKLMWKEDVRLYRAHGFKGVPLKLMKMMWKVQQLI